MMRNEVTLSVMVSAMVFVKSLVLFQADTFSIQIIATYSLLWPKATIPSDFFDLCDLYLWRVSVPWWSVSSTVEQNVVDYLRGGKTVEGECLTSPSLSRMLKMVSHLHSLRYSPNDEMTNDQLY